MKFVQKKSCKCKIEMQELHRQTAHKQRRLGSITQNRNSNERISLICVTKRIETLEKKKRRKSRNLYIKCRRVMAFCFALAQVWNYYFRNWSKISVKVTRRKENMSQSLSPHKPLEQNKTGHETTWNDSAHQSEWCFFILVTKRIEKNNWIGQRG